MPGQIELFTHIPILPALVRHLTTSGALNISLCATYLLESTFIVDKAKFFAGTLSAMSAMIMLEVPHVNVLSKMDLVRGSVTTRELKQFLDPNTGLLDGEGDATEDSSHQDDIVRGEGFKRLNRAVGQLIEDFSMVQFLRLEAQDEGSVGAILSYIDDAIQFHEAQEPREPHDEVEVDWENGG